MSRSKSNNNIVVQNNKIKRMIEANDIVDSKQYDFINSYKDSLLGYGAFQLNNIPNDFDFAKFGLNVESGANTVGE